MKTIEDWLYARLKGDSVIQGLTGVSTNPYNVYHEDPKLDIDFSTKSALFYREDSGVPFSDTPDDIRTLLYLFTGKGPNFDSILDRVNELLHDLEPEDIGDSPRKILKIKWDWSSPDLWDDNKETWYKQSRYMIIAQIPRSRD